MSLSRGQRLCLVGRNGAGKSSLLKIIGGQIEADDGVRFVQPGISIGYLEQAPDLSVHKTVLDFVMTGLPPEEAYRAAPYLEALGLAGDEATQTLSGGQARRAALVKVLAEEPDVLLLDEPTNHLDLPAIEWLEATLLGLDAAMIIISHDRRFLERSGNGVLWVDRGQIRFLDAGFETFEAYRDDVYAKEEEAAHKLAREIVREEHWLRYGVTARRKRNQKRLANLHNLREKKQNLTTPQGQVSLQHEGVDKSSKRVAEARGICKSYDGKCLVRDLSLRIMRGDRVGIVGPNGAGKTTIINMLTGVLAPDKGVVELGETLEIVTLDQARVSLKPNWTLKDALTSGGGDMVTIGGVSKHVIGYMKDFLFEPHQAQSPLDVLSGGELARVMLARALSLPSNMIVLDEPTNDLDLETLDLLEEFLHSYDGTVLLVSHDRDFLNRVVNGVLLFEGDAQWGFYAGGYDQAAARARPVTLTTKAKKKDAGSDLQEKPAQKAARQKPRKLSYKEKYALETLPDKMSALEGEIANLETKLGNPDFFSNDPVGFEETTKGLANAMAALQAFEDEWLALEMKREEIEGSE